MKINMLIIIALLLIVPSTLAVCTVTFDRDFSNPYHPQQTITASMLCSENGEKNVAYTLTWKNISNSAVLQTDTGTTPAVINTLFTKTFTVPTNWHTTELGYLINATLSGTGLEGNDTANITTSTDNDLLISEVGFTNIVLLGKRIGISFKVTDENNKLLSNALCSVYIQDIEGYPIETSNTNFVSFNGKAFYTQEITKNNFNEDTEYIAEIHCSCGRSNTTASCIDENGIEVTDSHGSAAGPFITNRWLTVNTVTDKSIYDLKEEIFICANVTNVNSTERIPMAIYNQIRCSSGTDNNEDRDRVLIVSDDEQPDERGISVNTTQMQCKRFMIPEARYLQGKSSQCYASTTVWVLNQERNKLISYATTSPVFNITSTELQLDVDWQKITEYEYNSIINLSKSPYKNNYNGTGIGNMDIRLYKSNSETLESSEQYQRSIVDIKNILLVDNIHNISVRNRTNNLTEGVDFQIEYLEDGFLELEVRDQDISQTGWVNITLWFEGFEERQTEALEGIENKTGTFHFDINCPTSGGIGQNMACILTAQIESGDVEKEVDFTCSIPAYDTEYSIINFNQMVTQVPYITTLNITVPGNFVHAQQYTVFCEASYYNLGSRTDTFYDTFLADKVNPPSNGGGAAGEGKADEVVQPPTKKVQDVLGVALKDWGILLIGLVCFMIFASKEDKRRGVKIEDKQ